MWETRAGTVEKERAAAQDQGCRNLLPGNQAPAPEVRDRLNSLRSGWSAYLSSGKRVIAYGTADNYVANGVRRLLMRCHKVSSQGTTRLPKRVLFRELGVLSLRHVALAPRGEP